MKLIALLLSALPLLAADLPTPTLTTLNGNKPTGVMLTWEYPQSDVMRVEAWNVTRWFKSPGGAGETNWFDHDYTLGLWSWPPETHVAGSCVVSFRWTDTSATPGVLYSYSVQALGSASDSKDSELRDLLVNPAAPANKIAWKMVPQVIPLEITPFTAPKLSFPNETSRESWGTNVFMAQRPPPVEPQPWQTNAFESKTRPRSVK